MDEKRRQEGQEIWETATPRNLMPMFMNYLRWKATFPRQDVPMHVVFILNRPLSKREMNYGLSLVHGQEGGGD